MTLLCATPACRKPGSHTTECLTRPDTPCRGCAPAQAADGLNLCQHHTRWIALDAVLAANLWIELGLCLVGSGTMEEIRTKGEKLGINLRDAVVEHRGDIRHTLVSWTLMISDERGIGTPADTITALGDYVARHNQWLAAHPAAGDASSELRELVTVGRALQQPSGTRVVPIGPCPVVAEERVCTGTLRALLRRQASLLPSAVTCDADATHSWDSTQWSKLGRAMKQARSVAA